MAEQTVKIRCPSLKCQRILSIPASARGKTVRCKTCGTVIKVPSVVQEKPSAGAA